MFCNWEAGIAAKMLGDYPQVSTASYNGRITLSREGEGKIKPLLDKLFDKLSTDGSG
ncbi:hypothetical protein [Parasphingorhabdus sp.]|uniref:hypothetical protein n=1 Tax=Parasphingorhabdus sp. TaxID=2709688 RepID=UPI00300327BF